MTETGIKVRKRHAKDWHKSAIARISLLYASKRYESAENYRVRATLTSIMCGRISLNIGMQKLREERLARKFKMSLPNLFWVKKQIAHIRMHLEMWSEDDDSIYTGEHTERLLQMLDVAIDDLFKDNDKIIDKR